MATLKEHQAAMAELLANGSGIPASASRLAHAMHDLLGVVMLQSAARENSVDIRMLFGLDDATTPGLNDKAISERQKPLKTDSHAKWPTPAEQRVKELENTIRQLKANNAKLRQQIAESSTAVDFWNRWSATPPEQAGCRKPDTDIPDCWHSWIKSPLGDYEVCAKCGIKPMDVFGPTKPDTQVCEHEWASLTRASQLECLHCGVIKQ